MSKRRQQHKQPKAYYSQGQAVGDKHDQRKQRGESQVSSERVVCNEEYDLSWFKFPNWCGGETWDRKIIIIDENQWMTPELNKLVLERITDNSVVVVAGDAKQRYSTKWRKDGFSD